MAQRKVIYPNLNAEIARSGLTIQMIADNLNISRNALYNKMRGINDFTLKDVTALQKILKCCGSGGDYTLDYLFFRDEQK